MVDLDDSQSSALSVSAKTDKLQQLTEQVLEELHIVMEDNPDITEEDAIDWAYELADGWTPTVNYDVLMLAANNLTLIGYRSILRNGATPVEVARAAVFDYLKEILYAEWRGLEQIQVLEHKTQAQGKEVGDAEA